MRSVYRMLVGVLLLAGMLTGSNALGQGGATGAISGAVVDSSGGSISGADVQIIDARTESIVRKLPTGTEGLFFVTLLPPGNYIVVVNKSATGAVAYRLYELFEHFGTGISMGSAAF